MNAINRVKEIVFKKDLVTTPKDIELEKLELQEVFQLQEVQNTIALLETFDFHSECFASYVYYLLNMGYNVHLYTLKKQMKDSFITNCNFPNDKFKIFSFTKFPTSEKFFEHLSKYKGIFLLTLLCRENNCYSNIIVDYFKRNNLLNRLYCINHEAFIYSSNKDIEEIMLNHTFTLRSGIKHGNTEYPFISPIYFGEFPNKIKNKKNSRVQFVCFTRNTQKNLRNYERLFNAVKSLITAGVTNFDITFTGVKEDDVADFIDDKIKYYLKFAGKLSYAEMYQVVLNSDYILFNIDENTIDYNKYLTKGITGSYSLSVGFARPVVVEYNLGITYNLKDKAILYKSQDLKNALEKAILISDKEYLNMEIELDKMANSLINKSIKNLKDVINEQ